ncbi:TonB-dependent receptor [Chitinophaga sp. 22620]|uniref:TonB-dependent receptor n=1 Tax=Chitinophaga sp. 22620 TaxID=3453952 RepID=UPI003F87AA1B
MKLTAVILLTAFLQVSASSSAQQITISQKNTTLEKVFRELHKQTGFQFFFQDEVLQKAARFDIQVKDGSIREVLDICFRNQPLEYSIVDKSIIIKPKSPPVAAPQPPVLEIKGRVTDSTGVPLQGVSVVITGTTKGVSTDANGNFSISAQETDVLRFSFIGFKSVNVPVAGKTFIEVALQQDVASLTDVVVVGYGSQKKENLTGAVATVAAKELESRPLVNLAQGLQGLVPNLNINLNSGRPGASANFNIRGVTSLNADGGSNNLGAPLVMVDGVQMDPNLIDPGDVESVTVLKDAASAAIYGARGAYGVILITTKTGKKNTPLRVSYAGSYTISKPTRLPDYLNSVDYIAMHREADRTGQVSGGSTASAPFTVQDSLMAAAYFADPANNPTGYPDPSNPSKYRYVGNTDWVDVLYPEWAPQHQHNLSVSGGAEKTTFMGSIGYFNQKGMLKQGNEDYTRINPSLKINTDATPWLSLQFKAALNHINNDVPNAPIIVSNYNTSYIQGDSRPVMPVYNPGGKDYAGQGSWTNPVAVLEQNGRDNTKANDLWLTGGLVITPVKNVKINADYTYNNYSAFRQQVQKQFPEYGVNGIFLGYYPWTFPDATTEISTNNNYNALNLYANYENTFSGGHYFKATMGYNQEHRKYKTVNSQAKNLINPNIPFIGLNSDLKPFIGGNEYEWALNGLLYRLNYIYKGKYLLEVNGRYDGTSAFPDGSRFVWSPSASAGWRISEESFFTRLKSAVNDLKLRVSYGQLPNQMFNPLSPSNSSIYPYIGLMPATASGYIFGSQQAIAVGAPGLVSPDFTWETVVTKDVGVDFAFLGNRLSGSFDWYIRTTRDMLVGGQPLPSVLGTTPPLKNAADLETKGWELSLTWKDDIGKDFNYSVRLGLSDYTSRITKYDLNPNQTIGSPYVGQKFNELWGYVTDGYFLTDAEAAAYNQSQLFGGTLMAGDIRYLDLNKDGEISPGESTVGNPGDRRIIGNSTPRYQYGVNLFAQYKSFDLSVFVQGVGKRDVMPNDNAFWGFYSEWSVPFNYMKDHWTPENPDAYFPRLRFGGGSNFQTQTKYLQSGAYARLKNVSLGYSLPSDLLQRIKMKSLRVYVTGQNLFEVTNLFKAYDPETIGFGTYPLSRSVSFGLQLSL